MRKLVIISYVICLLMVIGCGKTRNQNKLPTKTANWLLSTSTWNSLIANGLEFSLLYPTNLPPDYNTTNGILLSQSCTWPTKYKQAGAVLEMIVAGIDLRVESTDYKLLANVIGPEPMQTNKVDLKKSERELAALLGGRYTKSIIVKKAIIDNKEAVRIEEVVLDAGGRDWKRVYFIVPKYNRDLDLNFMLYTDKTGSVELLEHMIRTVRFTQI